MTIPQFIENYNVTSSAKVDPVNPRLWYVVVDINGDKVKEFEFLCPYEPDTETVLIQVRSKFNNIQYIKDDPSMKNYYEYIKDLYIEFVKVFDHYGMKDFMGEDY